MTEPPTVGAPGPPKSSSEVLDDAPPPRPLELEGELLVQAPSSEAAANSTMSAELHGRTCRSEPPLRDLTGQGRLPSRSRVVLRIL
jgi:hypothetical protein